MMRTVHCIQYTFTGNENYSSMKFGIETYKEDQNRCWFVEIRDIGYITRDLRTEYPISFKNDPKITV